MWTRLRGAPVVVVITWNLASCNNAGRKAEAPVPEAEQVVSPALKKLYMAAGAMSPRSPAQQKVILQMAESASNGKELLLVMRAAVGVFPVGAGPREQNLESRVRSMVTAKMMELGTVEQMIEYATAYSVSPESARPFVQRMFQLGGEERNSRLWYRIKGVAFHLNVADLERQAQDRADQPARR